MNSAVNKDFLTLNLIVLTVTVHWHPAMWTLQAKQSGLRVLAYRKEAQDQMGAALFSALRSSYRSGGPPGRPNDGSHRAKPVESRALLVAMEHSQQLQLAVQHWALQVVAQSRIL